MRKGEADAPHQSKAKPEQRVAERMRELLAALEQQRERAAHCDKVRDESAPALE